MSNSETINVQKNLFNHAFGKNFFLWVNPNDFLTANNICLTGILCSTPFSSENNPMFIPNPDYKDDLISPYHNNLIRRIRAEYWLDFYRPKEYPSRLQALYLCNSEDEAMEYQKVHTDHVYERILISGSSINSCCYSIHDSGWFDFLSISDAGIDEETIKYCCEEYWKGTNVEDGGLALNGYPWVQKPTREVLFYGSIKISDQHKEIIKNCSQHF